MFTGDLVALDPPLHPGGHIVAFPAEAPWHADMRPPDQDAAMTPRAPQWLHAPLTVSRLTRSQGPGYTLGIVSVEPLHLYASPGVPRMGTHRQVVRERSRCRQPPGARERPARRTPGRHRGYKDAPRPALSRTPADPYVVKPGICDLRALLLGFGAAFEAPILKHLLGGRRHPPSRLHRRLHGRLHGRLRLLNH